MSHTSSSIALPEEEIRAGRKNQHALAWRETLRWLESQPVRELRELARQRGASPHLTRKTELVAELVGLLADPDSVHKILEALEPQELATLEAIYLLAGHEPIGKRDVQKALLAWKGPAWAKDTDSILDRLAAKALLFRVSETTDETCLYRLPRAVSSALPSRSRQIEPYVLREGPALQVVEQSAVALLRAAAAIWHYIGNHAVRVRSPAERGPSEVITDGPYVPREAEGAGPVERPKKRSLDVASHLYVAVEYRPPELADEDLRELAKLTGCSPEMLDFLYALLGDLGLLTRLGDALQVNELALERYQKLVDVQQLQALVSAWLGTARWDELNLMLGQDPSLRLWRLRAPTNGETGDWLQELLLIRRLTARFLGLLDRDRWYSFGALREMLLQLRPHVVHAPPVSTQFPPWLWAEPASEVGTPDSAKALSAWGRALEAIVRGPLTWLGCVASACEEGRLVAFRLTGLGKYLLASYPQLVSGTSDMRPMTVGEDLTISIQLGRVDAEVHDFLGKFTDLVDTESDVFRYRITPAQLNQALEEGMTIEEIIAFLERVSGAAIPEAARRTLEAWRDSYGTVRLYENLTVIEFADDFALKELLSTTSLGQHIIQQLSPRLVVIAADAVAPLMAEMVKKGYTPKMEETLS